MQHTLVHTQSERFKLGWSAGFYDAFSDDGLRYLDEILRYGLNTDEQREFLSGYDAGRSYRRRSGVPCEPTAEASKVAA